MDNFIKVWKFEDAPAPLRALSKLGGREDFLMLIPPGWDRFWPDALSLEGTTFGQSDVTEQELPDGSLVMIGGHS